MRVSNYIEAIFASILMGLLVVVSAIVFRNGPDQTEQELQDLFFLCVCACVPQLTIWRFVFSL